MSNTASQQEAGKTWNPYRAGTDAANAWQEGYNGKSASYRLGSLLRKFYDEGRQARMKDGAQ
jgi:hypothetical protein